MDASATAPNTPRILDREPLVLNNRSYSWITNRICGIVENKQPALWWLLFIPSVLLTGLMVFCFVYLISTGVGVWGQKQPVAWAWDITNFVFWIGIGHAGTLISAILPVRKTVSRRVSSSSSSKLSVRIG